jgi:hypothetical protein
MSLQGVGRKSSITALVLLEFQLEQKQILAETVRPTL